MFAAGKTAGVSSAVNYIEDVFSTYLYTGTGATNTLTNNIDLSGKGGLVWIKSRSTAATMNVLFDSVRGATKNLYSNTTGAQVTETGQAFTSTGFTVTNFGETNGSGQTQVSWTFRKQPKFFDIVTYTGDGSNPRNISHNLGSVPGCIIVKKTSGTGDWAVYHQSLGNASNVWLNSTAAQNIGSSYWGTTTPTSTVFTVGSSIVNASGATYVAYIFANNAGGFGLTGTDNVISCGSFNTNASGNFTAVNLGFEPQWLLIKNITSAEDWLLVDSMRGFNYIAGSDVVLSPNTSSSEGFSGIANPTATGFSQDTSSGLGASKTYIYIAIRRGPMKVPTDGTKVFAPVAAQTTDVAGFPVDAVILANRDRASYSNTFAYDRLRGGGVYLVTNITNAEQSAVAVTFDSNTQVTASWLGAVANVFWNFQRAPSFFDEVCYTGTGANTTITHNLGGAPELIIVKSRSGAANWTVYSAAVGNTKYLQLNTTAAPGTLAAIWNNTSPTSSVFTVGTNVSVNGLGSTYVAYLFATCAGVSKVGSYTGNGSTQTINCGFAGGARFVLIKRTDSTGDWYVYDTARGMSTLTDPYLLLNSTAAESATLGSVTTVTTGFAVNASILAAINTNAASYVFFAVA